MKISFLLISCLVIGAIAAESYTSKISDADVDAILKNNRILTNYIKCMLGEGSCTPQGREIKKTLPDALANGCSKCNSHQKSTIDKVINHLKTTRQSDWSRLLRKYDPKGEYEKRFAASHVA